MPKDTLHSKNAIYRGCSIKETTQQTFVGLQDVLEDKKLLRWRRLGDKQNVYWGYVFSHGLPANLNQYLTNLYLTNLYFKNLRRIRNALIRTQ